MKKVAVIMAGGKGERFWPKSRNDKPKQFLSLTPDHVTMIQHTVNRLRTLIDAEDIFVVTNQSYRSLVCEQLPEIPVENILAEPMAKNTAPCIALAAAAVGAKYTDAVMIVLPSDHLIKNNQLFLEVLSDAAQAAEDGENLVTIGITPTYPETGYGYIKFDAVNDTHKDNVYQVEAFVEKPDMPKAKQYLSSGEYLWNSGMFVWKLSTIATNMKEHLPALHSGLLKMQSAFASNEWEQTVEEVFKNLDAVSIDYGIMEKADRIFTLPGNFGWDDVGSWLSLERFNPTNDDGNMISGDIITINAKNSIVVGAKKLIALVDVDDLVVVDTEDALLICAKDKTQNVKKVVETLKICNRKELL